MTLEQDLRAHIAPSLERNGLELVEVRFVAFSAPAMDAIRKSRGEAFLAEQKAGDLEQRGAEPADPGHAEPRSPDPVQLVQGSGRVRSPDRARAGDEGGDSPDRDGRPEADLRREAPERRDRPAALAGEPRSRTPIGRRQEAANAHRRAVRAQSPPRCRALKARQEADWEAFQHQLRKRDAAREDSSKETQLKAEAVRVKIGLADEALTLRHKKGEMDREEEEHRLEREQEARDRETKHELEKIHALSQVEQARLAADLKKTEVLKEMSVDQILALMGKDSPHLASALAERARAQAQAQSGAAANAELKAIYEKVLAGRESETDRLERLMDRAMQSVERVAAGASATERARKDEIKEVVNQDMDRMADVAMIRAGTPGASGGRSADVVCPQCKRQVPAGSRFCDNCGHKFFE